MIISPVTLTQYSKLINVFFDQPSVQTVCENIANHSAYSTYCIVQPKQGQSSHSHPSFNITFLQHIRKGKESFIYKCLEPVSSSEVSQKSQDHHCFKTPTLSAAQSSDFCLRSYNK